MSAAEVKPGYKVTEVGVIPEDWEVVRVDDIASLGRGRVISHKEISLAIAPLYPVYSSQTLNEGVMGYLDTYDFEGEYITWTTDGANAGKVFHRIGRFNCTNVCGVLKVTRHVPKFIALALDQVARNYVATNLANPKLMNNVMAQVKIGVPKDVNEQRAIAAALGDVDALLAALERLIAKRRAVKQAAMDALLSGRVRLPGFGQGAGYRQTEVGEIPEDWDIAKIEQLADIISGGTPSTSIKEYWDGGIPWCTPSDITANSEKYLRETSRTISAEGLRNSSATLLPAGTLLLCSRATIGEVKIAAQPTATNQGFKSLVVRSEIAENEFLYYKLLTLKSKLIEKGVGSTFLEVSRRDVGSLAFPLPPLPEQRAIAEVLSDMDAALAALERQRAKVQALKQGMMAELLTGRVRLV